MIKEINKKNNNDWTEKQSAKSSGLARAAEKNITLKGQYNSEPKKKDAEAIPILKYGPSNNFAKFIEAISKAALKQYGDLGRLIRQGSYYIPPKQNRAMYGFFDTANDPDGLNKATYLEAMKHHQKKLASMEDDQAKLFAMIMVYLSEESLDSVKKNQRGPRLKMKQMQKSYGLLQKTR